MNASYQLRVITPECMTESPIFDSFGEAYDFLYENFPWITEAHKEYFDDWNGTRVELLVEGRKAIVEIDVEFDDEKVYCE